MTEVKSREWFLCLVHQTRVHLPNWKNKPVRSVAPVFTTMHAAGHKTPATQMKTEVRRNRGEEKWNDDHDKLRIMTKLSRMKKYLFTVQHKLLEDNRRSIENKYPAKFFFCYITWRYIHIFLIDMLSVYAHWKKNMLICCILKLTCFTRVQPWIQTLTLSLV